jgi:hypothetical protein
LATSFFNFHDLLRRELERGLILTYSKESSLLPFLLSMVDFCLYAYLPL